MTETCATRVPRRRTPAPVIWGETASTSGKASISGIRFNASRSSAASERASCARRTRPGNGAIWPGSSACASMVTWDMSPAVRDMMNSANPPISADMKMKMNTPTATPTTSSAVCAFEAVR